MTGLVARGLDSRGLDSRGFDVRGPDVRALPLALFGAVSAHRSALVAVDDAIREPLAAGRRIGVMHLDPGVGATTLAEHAGRIAAARRDSPVLSVDVSGGPTGLAARLRIPATEPSETRSLARTSAEAEHGLRRAASGPFVLSSARPADQAIGVWLDEVVPIARFFDVVVTDFGRRHPMVDLAAAAALCDVVCLVSPADRGAAELSNSLAAAIRSLPESPAVVLALVDRAGTGGQASRAVATHSAHVVVRIPADPGLSRGKSPVTLAARTALLQLTAALVRGTTAGETTG